jgi:predicted helicase
VRPCKNRIFKYEEYMLNFVQDYYIEVAKAAEYGGTQKETALRTAFINLVNSYAKQNDLVLVAELSIRSQKDKSKIIQPDGTLKDCLRQDWGYWEAKDTSDNLDVEIKKKFDKGYPKDNILFEDTQIAVLFQGEKEIMRCRISDAEKFDILLKTFIKYERADVRDFRKSLELFKRDVPNITAAVRDLIIEAEKSNSGFIKQSGKFLSLCQENINPDIEMSDIREMIIQHILTEDIFNRIFGDNQFHRENNIANELENICKTFFFSEIKHQTKLRIKHYYDTLNAAAARVADHHEKQKILKVIYEAFYRSYNPSAADRLGVIYTPNEIVQFMVKGTDYLLQKHFDRLLEDENVEILDPATGTGTFVCELLDFIRKDKLEYKYRNEIHANEVAILPYYVSNLNIELTFSQRMKKYIPFENLIFADTLENMNTGYSGKQSEFGFMDENVKRIIRQNKRTISVIIGNPPYNANQQNENDNNPNRKYPKIDKRIKNTFIKNSNAQKTKAYDLFVRFYRWAFDRVSENGIVAFVTNRSFIDKKSFDGFRKTLSEEFDAVYVIDLGGDIRKENKTPVGNVFEIKIGVAIMFCIKKKEREYSHCRIHYIAMDDSLSKEQKLQQLSGWTIKDVENKCEIIRPDKNNYWINRPQKSEFDTFLPLCSKEVKAGKSGDAVFHSFQLGVSTNRDDWLIDFSKENLLSKTKFFIDKYKEQLESVKSSNSEFDNVIKWSRDLKNKLRQGRKVSFSPKKVGTLYYRVFVKKYCYRDRILVDRPSFMGEGNNAFIHFSFGQRATFQTIATDQVASLDMFIPDAVVSLPFFCYDKNNQPVDNITQWGLEQFRKHYKNNRITRKQIFEYVYAVLNNPAYRNEYENNLKREYPRIPFYDDFTKWATCGKKLLKLHIGYENVESYLLQVVDEKCCVDDPKAILKYNQTDNEIVLDENTKLTNIPKDTQRYKFGKRSAMEWILDQYKEKNIKDKTVAENFNTYRFSNYKPTVINLLQKICTVSIETIKILDKIGTD